VHSTAVYCVPVWCRSAHTRLIDPTINNALRIVTGCLRHTPADNLPILTGIQPAELGRNGATLSLGRRAMEPGHLLHQRSPVHRVHMYSASNQDTHLYPPHNNSSVSQTTKYVRRTGQITNGMRSGRTTPQDSRIFIPDTGIHPLGVILPRRTWVRLNRLLTDVGSFRSCSYEWGMASSAVCECGAEEQTVDHVVFQCPNHRLSHELDGLTVLDDETIECQLRTCPEI